MNTEKKIRDTYAEVFDEIHASDELLRKVKNMSKISNKKNIRTAVKVAYAATAAAVVLVASNIVAYAATGENLVTILLNGNQEVTLTEVSEGVYEGRFTSSDSDVQIILENDDGSGFNSSDTIYLMPDDGEYSNSTIGIESEGDRTYFIFGNSKVDITDNLADGKTEGNVECDGIIFHYSQNADGSFDIDLNDSEEITPDTNADGYAYTVTY